MEQTVCSETSAYKIQTPRNYPEESIQHSDHSKSLKSSAKLFSWGQNTVVGSGWLDWGSNPGGGKGVLFSISIQTRRDTHSAPGVPYHRWSGQRMAWPPTYHLALRLNMSRAIYGPLCASYGMLQGDFYLDFYI